MEIRGSNEEEEFKKWKVIYLDKSIKKFIACEANRMQIGMLESEVDKLNKLV